VANDGLPQQRSKTRNQTNTNRTTQDEMTNSNLLYSLLPIKKITSIGNQTVLQEFQDIGQAFVRECKERCQLLPGNNFLDIGCGIGRIAIPLTDYLDNAGRYEGFDIVPENIQWCQDNITTRHSNFRFQVADIFNNYYNPKGQYQAREFQFPYENDTFHVTCAASVFTHLVSSDCQQYFSEIGRTLHHGGYFLGTFFLINSASSAAIQQGKSSLPFSYNQKNNCFLVDSKKPEAATAYDEDLIVDFFHSSDFEITEIFHGQWSGREPTTYGGYQDMIVAKKLRK